MKLRYLSLVLMGLCLSHAQAVDDGQVLIMTYTRDTEPAGASPRFVVPDADAHDGTAQAALLGQSQPGGVIGSFYGYARPGAVYEITWRVKVKDNTSKEVVFKASASHNGTGTFKAGAIDVKGTDFKAANIYQEFSFTAEKGEGNFFGVQCFWGGLTDVHVDWCRIRSVRFFTEKELVDRTAPLELPDVWRLAPPAPLHIHVAKGLWWDFFQINDMLAWRQGGTLQSSYLEHGQYGSSLRNFPATAATMAENNVVLLANVDAEALGPRGRLLLEEYVRHGGALMLFGGRMTFTAGGYRNTALDRLLPCTFDSADRQSQREGLPISPTEIGKKRLASTSWEMRPLVFYYNRVTPRDGAEVWLNAGDKPLLLAWKFGKGRVACWTGSVEGDGGADRLAFWEWGGLPPTLDATMTWLTADQNPAPAPFDPDVDGKAIGRLVTLSMEKESEDQTAAIVEQLSAKCNSADFARNLISELVSADVSLDRRSVNHLTACVRRFVDARWSPLAQQLIATGRPGKVALGLRLLGFARGEAAIAELHKHLEVSAVPAMDAMGGPERILVGALQGAGDLGDVANLDAVTQISKTMEKQLPSDGDATLTGDVREEAYQHAILSRLKLGDATAARPLVDAVLKNILAMEQYQNFLDLMLTNKDDKVSIAGKKRAAIRLPLLRERHQALLAGAADLPAGAVAPLAAVLAERDDAILVPFAFAAFSPRPGRALDEPGLRGAVSLVEKSTIPPMRLLGLRMLQTSNATTASAMLTDTLSRLAASEKSADAIFAVRQAANLTAAQRAAVLEVAARNSSGEVQRWVRVSRVK